MVYEVSSSLELSQKKIQSLSERCQEFILKSACIEAIRNTYIRPVLEFYAPEGVDIDGDTVTLARALLRQGGILCALLNVFRGGTISKYTEMPSTITVEVFTDKSSVSNIDLFLLACKDDLFWMEEQLFDKKALYTEDTNVLAKAIAMTDKFFDKMKRVQKMDFDALISKLRATDPLFAGMVAAEKEKEGNGAVDNSVKENRLRAIAEILSTERQYVADLEKLQHYSEELRIDNIISPEAHSKIFSNLDQLVDFQRKFLVVIETCLKNKVLTDLQASYDAHIGTMFIKYEPGFRVYETFCGNHKQSLHTVETQKQLLKKKEKVLNPEVVPSYLIKPVQRVCRYPLLLREIIKSSAADAPDLQELEQANDAMKRITTLVNERQRREENAIIAAEFKAAVSDWKIGNVKIDQNILGELLLNEKAAVTQKKAEKELNLYLFENILLMCSETKTIMKSSKLSWTIRGAIYCKQISSIKNTSQAELNLWSVQISYRSYETEILSIKLINEEKVKLWIKIVSSLIVPVHPITTESAAIEESLQRRRSIVSMIRIPSSIASTASSQEDIEAMSIEAVRVKVTFDGETYILFLKEIESLKYLIEKTLEKIKKDWILMGKDWNLDPSNVRLKYKDSQNDLINLCNDEDLDIAMADCDQHHMMSFLVTKSKATTIPPSSNTNAISSSEKMTTNRILNGSVPLPIPNQKR